MSYDDWKTTEPPTEPPTIDLDHADDEPDDDCCPECGGEGYIVSGCFEDTCCCADPELEHDVITCPECHGTGDA
jgi:hypothetical protein